MKRLQKPHTTTGFALLLVTLSSAAIGEVPPRQFSEEAADIIPNIEYVNSCVDYIGEGELSLPVPRASCSEGLTDKVFIVFPPFNDDVAASAGVSGSYLPYSVCSRSDDPSTASSEGITCTIDSQGPDGVGTVSWTLDPADTIASLDDAPPPNPPTAINSVILENCQQSEGAMVTTYNHVYGPFGATRDAGLTMFLRDYYFDEFIRSEPLFVTFCYGDANTPQEVVTAEIPTCADTAVCPDPVNDNDETYLVEVSRLRDAEGKTLQPQAALDEDTCVCNPVGDEPLTQFDPAAIRDPDEGPGQVTRMDQWNGDPYFCTTLNGRRYCWAY